MTGLWLASYLMLWVVVVVMCLLLIGILRQLGFVQRELDGRPSEPQEESPIPDLEHDGPAIGSPVMELELDTLNGFGRLKLASLNERRPLLLMFMSPLCETCQHIVEPLNALTTDVDHMAHPVVIMRGDVQMCRAFLSVFPLYIPVICDGDRSITMGLDVHRAPFGLLYNENGTLMRKGVVGNRDDLFALLGDRPVSDEVRGHVFPAMVESLSANKS